MSKKKKSFGKSAVFGHHSIETVNKKSVDIVGTQLEVAPDKPATQVKKTLQKKAPVAKALPKDPPPTVVEKVKEPVEAAPKKVKSRKDNMKDGERLGVWIERDSIKKLDGYLFENKDEYGCKLSKTDVIRGCLIAHSIRGYDGLLGVNTAEEFANKLISMLESGGN